MMVPAPVASRVRSWHSAGTARPFSYPKMTPILSIPRSTLVTNGFLNTLHVLQRRLAHNGTAASRTVAALAISPPPRSSSVVEPKTHFRITLRRSGISLGKRIQGTLSALGLRRRMQTVYHPHTPEAAGMILAVKELVEVQNVSASAVRTAGQQRVERKAPRGFTVVRSRIA
jgi:large subunit ribosomal protein L30